MKNLIYCSITGADDLVDPNELVKLHKKYPFVEWGIPFSVERGGTPKYPSIKWIKAFIMAAKDMNKCAHLRDECIEKFANGDSEFIKLIEPFQRIQLNFDINNIQAETVNNAYRQASVNKGQAIIIPYNEQNQINVHNINIVELFKSIQENGIKYYVLFDSSFGEGKTPERWPNPLTQDVIYGYAGGLNPYNLEEELIKVIKATNGQNYWIDMETGVRTKYTTEEGEERNVFDLEKVEKCLEIVAKLAE